MTTQILHNLYTHLGGILLVEPGTMMFIAGGVILAGLVVGFYLYSETKKANNG